jgi:hypothetical protein
MQTKRFSIRNVTPELLARFSYGARIRNITEAQYLERLLDLHERCRKLADGLIPANEIHHYSQWMHDQLAELGLQTVRQEG